jgi:hypothetical protein
MRMMRHVRRLLIMSIGLLAASSASAKPPGLPTAPDGEFKVLSPLAQEFHEADEPRPSSIAVPASSSAAGMAAAAVGGGSVLLGAQSALTGWQFKIDLGFAPDWLTVFGRGWLWNVVASNDRAARQERMARDIFEMAQSHQRAGDWSEARTWYAGVKQLCPGSRYARLAEQQLERMNLARIAAEAGEEQSEEPPVAGPERLTVMPRPVSP